MIAPSVKRRVYAQTAAAFSVPVDEVRGRSRAADLVAARHAAWFILVRYYDAKLSDIAHFDGRHHTSVMHGVRMVKQWQPHDARYKALCVALLLCGSAGD